MVTRRAWVLGSKKKKHFYAFVLSLCCLSYAAYFLHGFHLMMLSEQKKLVDILKKAEEYCARLNGAVLYFVCIEKVSEKIYEPYRIKEWDKGWKTEINNYIYDYQLVRNGQIEERRILVRENGKCLNINDAPLKTKRFWYKYVIFGPIGLFSHTAQMIHNFSIEKETELWGKSAIIVKAVPKNKEESKWLFGKAWLDKSDGGILKIEWEEESIGNYASMQSYAKEIQARPNFKFSSE